MAADGDDLVRRLGTRDVADDTLNKVDPRDLNQSVAAWVPLVYLIADSDVDFRALAAAPRP